jgi:hypothetical protein
MAAFFISVQNDETAKGVAALIMIGVIFFMGRAVKKL